MHKSLEEHFKMHNIHFICF